MLALEQLLLQPKCELHLHLEGLASSSTLWQLKQKHRLHFLGIDSEHDLRRRLQVSSLDEFVACFINIVQECFRCETDLHLLFNDLRGYLKRNNIVYAEIFLAPSAWLRRGLNYEVIADVLQQGADEIEQSEQRRVRFLIDVSRSFGVENASRNLQLVLQHPRPAIIGIGLGGAERRGPAADFERVFKTAASHGLHRVVHAGEDLGPESIRAAIELLDAERIGHATSLPADMELLAEIRRRQIPIEACPSSNVFTGRYVKKLADHPLRLFCQQGLLVCVNTDDPTFFGVELNDEYRNLSKYCQLSNAEIQRLMQNAVQASFAPAAIKQQLLGSDN